MSKLIEMKNICKTYENGIKANKGINFTIYDKEVHALVGENGSGKTTLMKILFGLEKPSEGTIMYKGEPIKIAKSKSAMKYGIGMVHQHFMLIPSLTVLENIVLGKESKKGFLSLMRDKRQDEIVVKGLMQSNYLHVDIDAKVEEISVGEKQRVEIIKALYRGSKIIILDEPTAVLTPLETEELFNIIRELVNKGYSIVFITHKLDEVMTLSDRVTVLRNGKSITTLETKKTTKKMLSQLIIGRDINILQPIKNSIKNRVILKVENMSVKDDKGVLKLNNVSFKIRAGEILGIAGVEGNGQRELVEAISGLMSIDKGNILYNGEDLALKSVKQIRQMKVGYIPEDRQLVGASLNSSISDNLIIDHYKDKRFAKFFFLKRKQVSKHAKEIIGAYDIRVSNEQTIAGALSGGNLQKMIVAREISKNPDLLIASQPTRGVDIGSIQVIHKQILKKRNEGMAVLLVSAELSELIALSNRIAVIYNGEIVAMLNNDINLTENKIGEYMLGVENVELVEERVL